MKLDVPYKFLDLEPNFELVNFDWSNVSLERWMQFTTQRNTDPSFSETYSIPIFATHPEKQIRKMLSNDLLELQTLIMKEVAKLEAFFNATALLAVLDGLSPKAHILRHYDSQRVLLDYSKAHRVHLPLVTSWEVEFYIDDVPHYFEAGRYFEFDNQRYHEVKNNSDIFRIHLIVDLMPNKQS